MKLALIYPAEFVWSDDKELRTFWNDSKELAAYRRNFKGVSPGLLIVAALTPSSFEIEFIDENLDTIDFTKNYDLIGITAMTQQAKRAYEIADEFRKRGIKVILGGIHATCLPEEAKQHADSVVIGEAEYVWPRLIENFRESELKPFYESRKLVDLKKSPIPRYDLLKKENVSTIWVQTTRGCPHECEFCVASNIYGKKYRRKTIDQVLDEIDYIQKYFGRSKIGFSDDNMFVNKKLSKTLLKKLINKKIRYLAQSDISVAEDDELLGLLRKSGCIYLFIGFESLNPNNLKSINKSQWKFQYFKKYRAYIEKIQSYGIVVLGAFIVGFDHDTYSNLNDLSDFIIHNNLYGAQITILTPLPGSRLREKMVSENRILHSNWEKYTLFDVVYRPKNMSPEELQKGLLEIYKQCYSKEVYIKKIRYMKQIYENLKNVSVA